MAGIWTINGIKKIYEFIANKKPVYINKAKVNLSNNPSGSIELDPQMEELPNPNGEFDIEIKYDAHTNILYAKIFLPPEYSSDPFYINGIGLYSDDTLMYVSQVVPFRKLENQAVIKNERITFPIGLNFSLIGYQFLRKAEYDITLNPGEQQIIDTGEPISFVNVYINENNFLRKADDLISCTFRADTNWIYITNLTNKKLSVKVIAGLISNRIYGEKFTDLSLLVNNLIDKTMTTRDIPIQYKYPYLIDFLNYSKENHKEFDLLSDKDIYVKQNVYVEKGFITFAPTTLQDAYIETKAINLYKNEVSSGPTEIYVVATPDILYRTYTGFKYYIDYGKGYEELKSSKLTFDKKNDINEVRLKVVLPKGHQPKVFQGLALFWKYPDGE